MPTVLEEIFTVSDWQQGRAAFRQFGSHLNFLAKDAELHGTTHKNIRLFLQMLHYAGKQTLGRIHM